MSAPEVLFLRCRVEPRGRHGRIPSVEELALAIQEETNAGIRDWQIADLRSSPPPEDFLRAAQESVDRSDLAAARRAIARYGPPPPGEGTHPLQGHRGSMG